MADAQTYDFGAGVFDAIISRFGVMFFPDPVAAFTNLAQATAPGGRLVAAVWRTRDHVPLFDLPYAAAATVLDRSRPVLRPGGDRRQPVQPGHHREDRERARARRLERPAGPTEPSGPCTSAAS